MNISGLVITLCEEPQGRTELLSRLASDLRVELGVMQESRLPITFEAQSYREERAFWNHLLEDPTVADLHVVYHHFEVEPCSTPLTQETHHET